MANDKTDSMLIPHDEQVEMLKQAQDATNQLVDMMHATILVENGVLEIKVHDEGADSHTDPMVCIGNIISIIAGQVSYDTIAGKKFRRGYIVGYEHITPGCRTMRNGDPGYPDECEFIEQGEASTPEQAAVKALTLAFEQLVGSAAQAIEESKLFFEDE